MIVFGIQCTFFIVLPIRLKKCRYNTFFFTRQEVHAPTIGRVSEVLRIGRAICPGLSSIESPVLRCIFDLLLIFQY